jgi:hypothetical protein
MLQGFHYRGASRNSHFFFAFFGTCARASPPWQFAGEQYLVFKARVPPSFAQVPDGQYPLLTPRCAWAGTTAIIVASAKAASATDEVFMHTLQ